eukprot:2279231-Pyramimonas_sp.AAC.1
MKSYLFVCYGRASASAGDGRDGPQAVGPPGGRHVAAVPADSRHAVLGVARAGAAAAARHPAGGLDVPQ